MRCRWMGASVLLLALLWLLRLFLGLDPVRTGYAVVLLATG